MPSLTDLEKALAAFETAWNLGLYEEGLKIYHDGGKPLGLIEEIARYYEDQGDFEQAIEAWGHLVDSYFALGERLLPFFYHSNEIFFLGLWHASTDKNRARRYLMEYIRVARKYGNKPGFRFSYKAQALKILHQLSTQEEKNIALGGQDGR